MARANSFLDSFTCLNPYVYLRDSPESHFTDQPHKTIVICAWMNAPPKNISTYIAGYAHLDAKARMIVIRSTLPNMIYRPTKTQQLNLQPAVDAIHARPAEKVLIHTFSNAGAQQAGILAAAFLEATGRIMPVEAMIVDSAPSRASMGRAKPMLFYELPRSWYFWYPGVVVAWFIMFIFWAMEIIIPHRNELDQTREKLNNTSLFKPYTARAYIYSKTDVLVRWDDVEDHWRDAIAKGWLATKHEFVGGAHVRHVKIDAERYWALVSQLLQP